MSAEDDMHQYWMDIVGAEFLARIENAGQYTGTCEFDKDDQDRALARSAVGIVLRGFCTRHGASPNVVTGLLEALADLMISIECEVQGFDGLAQVLAGFSAAYGRLKGRGNGE